jgi:hypothetical protein
MSPSADLVAETAAAMATNGLQAAGYSYINLDDGIVQVGESFQNKAVCRAWCGAWCVGFEKP